MIFRPSQRLNAKIKVGTLSAAPLDANPYADWTARLFTASRSQYILLSNTASLYSVVMYGRGIPDGGLFIGLAMTSIREFMTDDGLGLIFANFIAPATRTVYFRKSLNRAVTGSMNELEIVAKLGLESDERSPFEMSKHLNKILLSSIASPESPGYATPREAITRLRK